MSIQDQIALLRGAACVPKNASLAMASAGSEAANANRLPLVRACHVFDNMLAATPPAYAEALAAVLDGYEAMQAALVEHVAAADAFLTGRGGTAALLRFGESDMALRNIVAKLGEKA